jgi:hypothetical protein
MKQMASISYFDLTAQPEVDAAFFSHPQTIAAYRSWDLWAVTCGLLINGEAFLDQRAAQGWSPSAAPPKQWRRPVLQAAPAVLPRLLATSQGCSSAVMHAVHLPPLCTQALSADMPSAPRSTAPSTTRSGWPAS